MQLFDIKTKPIVLSASRMTDMPKFYPKEIIEEVEKRREKGMDVHTLVLWTKHPRALFADPLYSYLKKVKEEGIQLYLQLTVTGMGKQPVGIRKDKKVLKLEPNVPTFQEAANLFPDLVELVGKGERIRLRIDPIVRIKDSKGEVYSNLSTFSEIVEAGAQVNIRHISFSFLEKTTHKKVDRRFKDLGCEILSPTEEEREKTKVWMQKLQDQYQVQISSCSVPGMPVSKCIDGELLRQRHDRQLPADLFQPKKRELCGCTQSIDIGGWPPKKCFSGCEYCYANAKLEAL